MGTFLRVFKHVTLFLSTSDKPESKSVTHVGSCTAWNMESSLMVRCLLTRPLEVVTILSTLSSARLVLVNTSQELSLWILNQLSLMKCVLVPTVNYFTRNN